MMIQKQSVLITGAGGTVGKAVTAFFLQKGYRVVLSDLDFNRHRKPEVASNHLVLVPFQLTTSSYHAFAEKVGNVDGFIHCAEVHPRKDEEDYTTAMHTNLALVNVRAPSLIIKILAGQPGSALKTAVVLGATEGYCRKDDPYSWSQASAQRMVHRKALDFPSVRVNRISFGSLAGTRELVPHTTLTAERVAQEVFRFFTPDAPVKSGETHILRPPTS